MKKQKFTHIKKIIDKKKFKRNKAIS